MARGLLARWARRIVATAWIVAIVASVVPAYATPKSAIDMTVTKGTAAFRKQLAAKQLQVDTLNEKLDELDRQAEIASEEYNEATYQLAQANAKVDAAQNDLNNSRTALAIQNELFENRLAAVYRDGNLTAFSILLDSKSVGDFVSRVKFINVVNLSDANTAAELRAQKDLTESQLQQLQTAQTLAQELDFELKARQVEVELRQAESQQLLDSAQAEVRQLIKAEAARRERQQKRLMKQVLSGANKAGIVVTPGSPVETALAYHGVPYVWGGATPSGFDCSGLVLYVFEQHGVTLPHYSGWQIRRGKKIPRSQIQPNDVVFFGSPVHHVGIYVGGGYFIHAPRTGDYVKISKLSERSDVAGIRRYPWLIRTDPIKNAQSSTSRALKSVR
jgi:cell wall-associated NlpC family hydrolase